MSVAFPDKPIHGRGTPENPGNRFEPLHQEIEVDWSDMPDEDRPLPRTKFYRDNSQTIISYNDSPDIGFEASLNPYRGCEHGCIYCYARPFHEYLGLSAGLDFETKIIVKDKAPALLRKELGSRKWKPQTLATSGVTDCYQPVERKLRITRGCLEVLAECRNPVALITKNHLITRDIDVLQELARYNCAFVTLSITTLDDELARVMEPRTSMPRARLAAIEKISAAGIPVGVNVAPVIPGLTDHELPSIIDAAVKAGARVANYVPLRLPYAVKDMFSSWLEQHFPLRKEKVLAQIRAIRGGKLNDPNFGSRMQGTGIFADQIQQMFEVACRKSGLQEMRFDLSTDHFRRPQGAQLQLL